MIDHLKTTLTASGCSLVAYESDQLANIFADQSHADDIIGLIIEPNSMTFNASGNGVTKEFPATTVEIMKQVKPEDTAENNRTTLESLAEIARYFIFGLIGSGLYHKIPTVTANKIFEKKYDANVIGWSLSIPLRPLSNQNNCELTFPAGSTVEPINFIRLTADELAAIRGANDPSGSNVFATMDDLPENELTPDELAAISGAASPSALNVFVTMNDIPPDELTGDQLDAIQHAHSPSLYNPFATLNDTPVIPNATESAAGIAEIATQTETNAGVDDERIVTPLKQKTFVDAAIAAITNHETISRTIYITTTGNDITGDGTIGSPFLTIAKALSTIENIINSGVVITINIGVGTFTLTADDISAYNLFTGDGSISTIGTLALVNNGFTMGAALPTDPLTFAVSGGTSATWTLDQWKFYFLKSGAVYYPITHNSLTPTLSTVGNFTGTEIYQTQTILNCTGKFAFETSKLATVDFRSMEIDLTNINHGYGNGTIQEVYFKGIGSTTRILGDKRLTLLRCCFNSVKVYSVEPGLMNFNFIYMNANTYCISFDAGVIGGIVMENPNTSSSAAGVYLNAQSWSVLGLSTQNWKFVNTGHCIYVFAKANVQLYIPAVILVNCPYFIRKNAAVTDYTPNKIIIETTPVGTPTTRWFYDAMNQFVNLSNGRLILIPSIIYPEIENNLSAALPNNATTNVVIGNKLQNRSIVIDYTITRGTTYELGRLQIIHNGTTLTLVESTPVGDDVGVTFAVAFSTNVIQLQCTMTNTGTAATMKYNASRVIITPLTI